MLTINKKKFEFSGLGMIMSLILLVFSFALVHGYWLGEPFESYLSILVTLYLLTCTWAFPYIIKELGERFEHDVERTGFTIFQGMSVLAYFIAPFIYFYLKYFDTKNEGNEEYNKRNKQNEKNEFSRRGFIIGSFLFFITITFLHAAWIGNFFESFLSIFVTIYLGICVWTFSYTLKDLNYIIDKILDKPLGRVILLFVYLLLYLISPFVFIRLKFFGKK